MTPFESIVASRVSSASQVNVVEMTAFVVPSCSVPKIWSSNPTGIGGSRRTRR